MRLVLALIQLFSFLSLCNGFLSTSKGPSDAATTSRTSSSLDLGRRDEQESRMRRELFGKSVAILPKMTQAKSLGLKKLGGLASKIRNVGGVMVRSDSLDLKISPSSSDELLSILTSNASVLLFRMNSNAT
jgi:hypothetical protein